MAGACEQRGHGVEVLHEGDAAHCRKSTRRDVSHPVRAHTHHVQVDVVDELAFVAQPTRLTVFGQGETKLSREAQHVRGHEALWLLHAVEELERHHPRVFTEHFLPRVRYALVHELEPSAASYATITPEGEARMHAVHHHEDL